jgi:dTDP-4-amino-4,6-dideoxygalactose transaminase
MEVPFVDLRSQHARIRQELDAAIRAVVDQAAFIQGEPLERFERQLAEFFGVRRAVGVANGTAALSITLRALGIGAGDEVITTAHSAVPTPESIVLAGAKPVLVDVDDDTWLIDPEQVKRAITPRTRAILPVHLYGMPADLDRLGALAGEHGLALIEDCAQAAGARWHGRRVGTFGKASAHSFFPSKNLGGFGDGGAIATDDEAIERFAEMYRNHGRLEKFTHEIIGANERLDSLQAAVLTVKLGYLDDWNQRRRQVAQWYHEELAGVREVLLQRIPAGAEPVWHLFVVRVARRNELAGVLKTKGIGTGVHYPLALNLQPSFAFLGQGRGALPIAERVCDEVLSLPMDPFLTHEQVRYVCDALKQACVRPGGR